MAEDQNGQPDGEYSRMTTGVDMAIGPDVTVTLFVKPCRFCEVPVVQPKHGKVQKDFCSSRHRAAYREREHQKAIAMTLEAIDEAQAVLEESMARLAGARTVLQRFQKKGK